jgi:ABC-type branched-subunit amino acid transport system substrate-binding protein
LLWRDTHNDPGATPQLVRDLAQDQNLLAILGPLTSGVAQSAAQGAQAAGVPLIALSQKADLTQTGNLIFQDFLTARQQVRGLVRRTLGSQGIKRYAVLYPDSPYGRTFLENFQEELAAQGGELAAQEAYAPGTRDFTPVLTSLKAAFQPDTAAPPGFEALFIPDDAATVAAIAGPLADTSLRSVQLLGTNLLHAAEVPEAQLKALEGIVFPDAFFAGDPNGAVQNFIAAYQQQYGEAPDYLATQGYVVVKVMTQLLEADKSLTRTDLPRRLLGLKEFPNLPWFKGFNDRREAEPALYLLTIKDGRVQIAS